MPSVSGYPPRALRHNQRLLLAVADVLMEVEVVRQRASQPRPDIRLARAGFARSRSAMR